MTNIENQLNTQLNNFSNLLTKSDAIIRKYKHFETSYAVDASSAHGSPQFRIRDTTTGKRTYAKVSDMPMVKKLVQMDYDLKVNASIKKQHKVLERFLKQYNPHSVVDVYEHFCTSKQNLISPLLMPDKEYIEKWLGDHPGELNPSFPEERIYQTNRGEMVRSKSEKILADLFLKYGIPYQIEPALTLKGYRYTINPDFVLLNVHTRQTKYWEHFGRLDLDSYASKNFKKIAAYEKNGFFIGDNLIITMESDSDHLDTKIVEEKIRQHLL